MLELRNVSLHRDAQQALSGIDFELSAGDMVGILGSNGAGKSSLLAVLAGELRPDQGTASLDGRPLTDFAPRALARRRALLPQTQALPFELSVEEIVGMGAYPWPELTPSQVDELVGQALLDTDAHTLRHRLYPTLSGGEALRVQFARMLVQIRGGENTSPRFLLLDEPTAHLDPKHQHQLLEAAQSLTHNAAIGVAVVLHDINLAGRWCKRLVLLKQGRLIAQGATSTVLTRNNLEATYDCPAQVIPHPQDKDRMLALLG